MEPVLAIDVHAHYGACASATASVLQQALTSGDEAVVVDRARRAKTCLTIVSPLEALMPRHNADPVSGNLHAAEVVARTEGLRQWVVVDPLKPETFEQADDMLKRPACAGMKIHPEEHGYHISEHGEALFAFAADRRATVQSHSGERNSLPEDLVTFADRFPEVTLIVSHLGCGWDGDLTHQVRAIQSSRRGNVFTDTSSAMSITSGLLEWAVKEIGADRIFYGTDSPLYFAPMQRARIEHAAISDQDRRLILRENALARLNLGEVPGGGEQ